MDRQFTLWSGMLLPLMCASAFAADFYVSPTGKDGNRGSQNSPFRTIARGVQAARSGDRILLLDGVYGNEGHISDRSGGWWRGYVAPVTISKSGTANAWITLKAAHRWGAVLDCGTSARSMGCDKNIILGAGAAYWSFEDLVFTGGAFGGIGTDAGASNIRVKGCRFEYIGNWYDTTQIGEDGIGFDINATNWRIEGNVFHDIGRTGGLSYDNHDHGIYAKGVNITVINNIFYNISKGWSIQTSDGSSGWLIANNTFVGPSSGNGQIMLWNTNTNIRIQNNIFYNPKNVAIEQYESSVKDCTVDHNMVFSASDGRSDTKVRTLAADRLSVCAGMNQVGVDPGFVNVTQQPYDFHLRPGSPGISAGVPIADVTVDFDGVTRPQGHPPSLGAYEPSSASARPDITPAALNGTRLSP